MEFTQHFLPGRYPSLMDWTLNSLGAAAGLSLAIAIHSAGAGVRWSTVRERWFVPHSGATLALLLLWPIGFLYPSTVPFGQGVSWERLQEAALRPAQRPPAGALVRLAVGQPGREHRHDVQGRGRLRGGARPAGPLPGRVRDRAAGLAARGHRADRGGGGAGGQHAVGGAQLRPGACAGLGDVDACRSAWPSARWWRWPASSSASAPPRRWAWWRCRWTSRWWRRRRPIRTTPTAYRPWEQGRFIHFHGLAQWVGWLWPFAAGIALFRRLVRGDGPRAD